MKIGFLAHSFLLFTFCAHGMQDQPIPGLQIMGSDGKIYDICQTTGIAMRCIPAEEIRSSTHVTREQVPGMLQAVYEQINTAKNSLVPKK